MTDKPDIVELARDAAAAALSTANREYHSTVAAEIERLRTVNESPHNCAECGADITLHVLAEVDALRQRVQEANERLDQERDRHREQIEAAKKECDRVQERLNEAAETRRTQIDALKDARQRVKELEATNAEITEHAQDAWQSESRLQERVQEAEEELARHKRTTKFQEDLYLKNHGGSWGECKYHAEVKRLRDPARLRKAAEEIADEQPTLKGARTREVNIRIILAILTRTIQGAEPSEASKRILAYWSRKKAMGAPDGQADEPQGDIVERARSASGIGISHPHMRGISEVLLICATEIETLRKRSRSPGGEA